MVMRLHWTLQIEAAYDVLFMQSMKKRISGELEVSSSVRYADVPTRKRSSSVRHTAVTGWPQLRLWGQSI
jgi:hypothetical protein